MTNENYRIYKHTNQITNRAYIGITNSSIESRWNQHVDSSKRKDGFKFHRSIAKHGEEAFLHETLEIVDSLTEAKKLEIYYIKLYDTFKKGYNSTPGGDGVYERTPLQNKARAVYMKEAYKNGDLVSPFSIPEIHNKTIKTRSKNGTNVFATNNPMFNEYTKAKKLCSMPSMKGRKQWVNTFTGDHKQQLNHPEPKHEWVNKGFRVGISQNKGIPKPKKTCPICGNLFSSQTMSRHVRSKHENN